MFISAVVLWLLFVVVTFRVPSNHSECAHKVGLDSIGVRLSNDISLTPEIL